ncbi:hypothetical protein RJT34_13295 [Clitoria ternatea]|uniref:Uncharacterized protein n=1 Tax=Clitoria ternatea TaxID=43366 RepID=A0AAN9JR98_CLITE
MDDYRVLANQTRLHPLSYEGGNALPRGSIQLLRRKDKRVGGDLEKVWFKTKVSRNIEGGLDVKVTIDYYTKGEEDLPVEMCNELKAKANGLFRAIEHHTKATQD